MRSKDMAASEQKDCRSTVIYATLLYIFGHAYGCIATGCIMQWHTHAPPALLVVRNGI